MATLPASDNEYPSVLLVDGAAPTAPATGMLRVFASAAGRLSQLAPTGAAEIIALGASLVARLEAHNLADQQLDDTAGVVVLNSTHANFGPLTRSGNTFVPSRAGFAVVLVQAQVRLDVNNTTVTLWGRQNGTAVEHSGVRYNSGAVNDETVLVLEFAISVAASDVLDIYAVTSTNNGATLNFTAATGSLPDISAVSVIVALYVEP